MGITELYTRIVDNTLKDPNDTVVHSHKKLFTEPGPSSKHCLCCITLLGNDTNACIAHTHALEESWEDSGTKG
jgi:hypothetical protein